MWPWQRGDPVLDTETLNGIVRKLMAIDDKLDDVLEHLEGRDDGEEEDDA